MSKKPTAPITQAALDAAEADALSAIADIRAFREVKSDVDPDYLRRARNAQKVIGRFVRLYERMVAQERRNLRLRGVKVLSAKIVEAFE